jgi:DNA-binding CsgD family transcriptional regulator
MGHSVRIRLGEIRSVFRLLGEMRELKARTAAWQEHMIVGLCRFTGARQGASMHWRGFTSAGRIELLDFSAGGWAEPSSALLWAEMMRREDWRGDPILNRTSPIRHAVATRVREQLVDDRDWYRSEVVQAIAQIAKVDNPLVSFFRRNPPDEVSGISLQRGANDRRFSERDRRLLHLFNLERRRLYDSGAFDRVEESRELSPRLKQVLDLLLVGDGEKQVARKLGLSKHTVNDYVKGLYKRFDVHSRGELMARFVGGQKTAGDLEPESRSRKSE